MSKKLFSAMSRRRRCVLVLKTNAVWNATVLRKKRCESCLLVKWLRNKGVRPKKRRLMTNRPSFGRLTRIITSLRSSVLHLRLRTLIGRIRASFSVRWRKKPPVARCVA